MKRWLIVGGSLFVALLLLLLWYSNALGAPCKSNDGQERVVEIRENETLTEIGSALKSQGVIKSTFAFGLHVRINGLSPKFQSGAHSVSCAQRAPVVAQALTRQPEQRFFTIKEGWTLDQVASSLADKGIVDEGKFKSLKAKDFPEYTFLKDAPSDATLEGFLYPETYAVPKAGTTEADVAKIMLDQFKRIYETKLNEGEGAKDRPVKNFYETVIVASMIEEEVRSETDRALVGGIIYNRLNQGIRLDIDATTRYALGKPTASLTVDDLNSNNPYNTRKVKGLPPGPISNPGLTALQAALYPKESDYLFYLTGRDGKTYFAKTNEEHEQNISKHLQ